jgi:PKD-like domain/Secretion system C-terminal sorting domain
MKKLSILLSFLTLIKFISVAQITISPLQSAEYCPNTNIAFSVSGIPGTVNNVTGYLSNAQVISVSSFGNGYINFIGKFGDQNSKQTFRVLYKDLNGVNQTFDFPFRKIKSLALTSSNQATIITPNLTSFNAPRCQISTFNLNFANIQFATIFESPEIIFGSISTFQYLLPIGWKLNNGTPSDGVTWINGTNAAVVTSNLTNGDGGFVKIRAINPCSPNLVKSAEKSIPISRPKPRLSIDGALDICSGFKTYTLGGLPPGASVVWSLSTNPNASIPNSSTGATVNVSNNGASSGSVTLTATVSDCITTYPSITKIIYLGALPLSLYALPGAETVYESAGYYYTLTYPYQLSTPTNIFWRVPTGWIIQNGQGTSNITVFTGNTGGAVQVDFDNNCGQATGIFKTVVIGTGGPLPLRQASKIKVDIFPNPSRGQFIVSLDNNNKTIKEVRIKNKMGMIIFNQKFNNNQKQQNIILYNQPMDIYVVEVYDGSQWATQKLILEK